MTARARAVGWTARIVAHAQARRGYLAVGAVVLLVALGLSALHHLTRQVRLADARAAFYAIDPRQIALAVLLTVASYIALTFYDVIALRVIGRPLRWRTAAMACAAASEPDAVV